MRKKNYTIKSGKKANPLNFIVLFITILAFLGIFFITQSQKDSDKPTSLVSGPAKLDSENPLLSGSTYDKPTKKVYLITDKWSLLNIPNKD